MTTICVSCRRPFTSTTRSQCYSCRPREESVPPTEVLVRFLRAIGARRRQDGLNDKFILDEWCSDFYLIFDMSVCEETETLGTADILAAHCGVDPRSTDQQILLKRNCSCEEIWAFLCTLGFERFPEQTIAALRAFGVAQVSKR